MNHSNENGRPSLVTTTPGARALPTLFMCALGVFVFTATTACSHGPQTTVLDPSADDGLGGNGTESGDVRAMADKISRGVTHSLKRSKKESARIAVTSIKNATRFRIDTHVIRKKLTTDLVKQSTGATYLARDAEAMVRRERVQKRNGQYTLQKRDAAMLGADYFLVGQMRAISKSAREGLSDYIIYSFELVDAENGAIVWADDFETKRRSNIDVLYQ